MEIAVVGISHKEAPVPVRGLVAFTRSMKKEATVHLKLKGLGEFLIISTCNRSEIYMATKDMKKDLSVVKDYYVRMAGYQIEPYIFEKKYEVALQHIYQVATGLDSLIIGEDEILGQMKEALDFAIEHASSKKILTKVVREAITFSKKTRHAYKLSENQLSVAAIGVKYLKEFYGDISKKKIMVIGTGVMGQLILRYLEQEDNPNIYLTNRTMNKDKVDYFVSKNIHVIDYDDRYNILSDMEIIISATASPHKVIQSHQLPELVQEMTFIDMAVPRDIDVEIDALAMANVITLDDFKTIADKHMKLRQETANQINRLILEEVKELELWILRSKADNIIKGFHDRQKQILADNTKTIEAMNLTKSQTDQLVDMVNRSTWGMVKEPVRHLKTISEEEDMDHYKMILEKLFNLESGDR